MRNKLVIPGILFSTLFIWACVSSQKTHAVKRAHIFGQIKNGSGNIYNKGRPVIEPGLPAFIKYDNRILAQTAEDEKGVFELSFDRNGETYYDLYCVLGLDTCLLISIPPFKEDTINYDFYTHKYKATEKILCPKCRKTDMTRPINYDDYVAWKKRIFASGQDTVNLAMVRLAIYKIWICDRDTVKFF